MFEASLSRWAILGVSILIGFLSYSSQWLFLYLEPSPLDLQQTIKFNCLVLCIWFCYARACLTDPGHAPKEWKPGWSNDLGSRKDESSYRYRWCRKCEALKPPRVHHCRVCEKCIPKMDHHCPWTANCVSYRTFPHFIRFLFYAVVSLVYSEYFLYVRAAALWQSRSLPSYLGPSAFQLIHLFTLLVINSLTLFALSVILVRSLWSLGSNTTTIEGWEIERHQALLRRARVLGGYLDGPDGVKVRIERQEFPYDIGIWKNLKQGMGGSSNVLAWFWPFAATPSDQSGAHSEVNEFEDPSLSWPPPDPDRIPRMRRYSDSGDAFTHREGQNSNEDPIESFRRRQQEDMRRFQGSQSQFYKRKPFHDRYSLKEEEYAEDAPDSQSGGSSAGEEGWRNSEGECLGDFGVEEEVEFYDEDDIPLAELLRRRKRAEVVVDEI